jgi:hypothetical protein
MAKKIRIDHDALVNALVAFVRTADTDTLEAIAVQELAVVKDATFDSDTDSFIIEVDTELFTIEKAIEEFAQFGSEAADASDPEIVEDTDGE